MFPSIVCKGLSMNQCIHCPVMFYQFCCATSQSHNNSFAAIHKCTISAGSGPAIGLSNWYSGTEWQAWGGHWCQHPTPPPPSILFSGCCFCYPLLWLAHWGMCHSHRGSFVSPSLSLLPLLLLSDCCLSEPHHRLIPHSTGLGCSMVSSSSSGGGSAHRVACPCAR